ncbi:MAG: ABC transporter substrate-binding protein [Betaproteobacteria bacterium]
MSNVKLMGRALAGAAALALATAASAQQRDIVLGLQCDRTGATQTVGVFLCPGYHDYIALVNSKGGVGGARLRAMEIDHEYKVPSAVESYERHKKEGAVLISLYGTPQTQALQQRLAEDKIAGTSPGFGTAAAASGDKYPYLFPIAATYWSQAAGAVQFVKDRLGKNLRGKKIAYLYFDNPAGREPLPVLEALAKEEGFEMRTFAVPPPGVEMGAQVLDIAQRFRPDFVIAHLFGRSPSVSIKELKRAGYPLSKVVSFVWGASEADIEAAGGWGVAEGYCGIQFAGVGSDYPVLREIVEMYKKQGKPAPREMASTVFYNRGVLIAAVHVEAVRNAVKAKGGTNITPDDVKKGFEQIRGFTLGGLVPPLEINAVDHEGGGWVQVFQAKGGQWVKQTEWFKGYPTLLKKMLATGG